MGFKFEKHVYAKHVIIAKKLKNKITTHQYIGKTTCKKWPNVFSSAIFKFLGVVCSIKGCCVAKIIFKRF
jgi:hypothetical protein